MGQVIEAIRLFESAGLSASEAQQMAEGVEKLFESRCASKEDLHAAEHRLKRELSTGLNALAVQMEKSNGTLKFMIGVAVTGAWSPVIVALVKALGQ